MIEMKHARQSVHVDMSKHPGNLRADGNLSLQDPNLNRRAQKQNKHPLRNCCLH